MEIKSLTIYCSSSNLLESKYYNLSNKIAKFLVKRNISIIYGGGKIGMMGVIAKTAMKNNGKVIGIIPKFLNKKEIINYEISKIIITNNMSERKEKLFKQGDAFLILPGGSGTIEEAVEIISWKILGLHNKKIIIFNFQNYWSPLIQMYKNAKIKNFGNKNLQNICEHIKTFKEFKKLFNE